MKKTFIICLATLFLFVGTAMAEDITLSFQWDKNTEADLAGYMVNHRVEGQGYDYTNPIKAIHLTDAGFDPENPATDVTFNVMDNTQIKNYFVLRAFDTNDNESGDSNEVWGDIDLRTPSAPVITATVYNDQTQTVDFTFDQSNLELVDRWEFYMANNTGGPYTKINDLSKTDPPVFTTSWNVPGDEDYFFVMVAFRNGSDTLSEDGTQFTSINSGFSTNSNEASAQVKIHPSPNFTFKVKMRVY